MGIFCNVIVKSCISVSVASCMVNTVNASMRRDACWRRRELSGNAKWNGGVLAAEPDGSMGVPYSYPSPLWLTSHSRKEACARATPQLDIRPQLRPSTTMQQEQLCMHRVECYEQCHTPTLTRWRITERAGTRPRCAPSLISPGMHACTTLRSRPMTRGCRLPQQPRHRCARARPACALPCPGGHMAPPRLERGPRGNSLQLRV